MGLVGLGSKGSGLEPLVAVADITCAHSHGNHSPGLPPLVDQGIGLATKGAAWQVESYPLTNAFDVPSAELAKRLRYTKAGGVLKFSHNRSAGW